MTKKELEEIRDIIRLTNYKGPEHNHGVDYVLGFDDCAEILLPIIKDYEEALGHIASFLIKCDGCSCPEISLSEHYAYIAKDVLKKYRGSE